MSYVIIEPNSYCWLWNGSLTGAYGGMMVGRKLDWTDRREYVHRLAYEHFVGPIPYGIFVCHKCDVPSCCNPDHLFVGTQSDNLRDAASKRRNVSQRRPGLRRGTRNGRAKLTESLVAEIRARHCAGESGRSLARAFGVNASTIRRALDGTGWVHVAA